MCFSEVSSKIAILKGKLGQSKQSIALNNFPQLLPSSSQEVLAIIKKVIQFRWPNCLAAAIRNHFQDLGCSLLCFFGHSNCVNLNKLHHFPCHIYVLYQCPSETKAPRINKQKRQKKKRKEICLQPLGVVTFGSICFLQEHDSKYSRVGKVAFK